MNLAVISPLSSVSAFVPSLLKGTEPLVLYDENTSPDWGQRYYQWQNRDSQLFRKSWTIIWDGYIKDDHNMEQYIQDGILKYEFSVRNQFGTTPSALYTSSAMQGFKYEN